MNWIDAQTKEMLQKAPPPVLSPPKVAEFALVLLRKGADPKRLIRAIIRINECSESRASTLARQSTPAVVHRDLGEADALFGQFELICCDAVSIFVRSEVLEQSDGSYLHGLFQQVLQSPEFKPTSVRVRSIPKTVPGQKFADQFLGVGCSESAGLSFPLVVNVPHKKARIMKHWAPRVQAVVECDIA